MWRINGKGTMVDRGRPCIANNPGSNAGCLAQVYGNRDAEKWSSEYTQKESCTIANGLQLG